MLSNTLKKFREQCDLTQKQVAESLNIDRSTYTYYETGKSSPSIDTLVKLAKIFNTSLDELMDYEPATPTLHDNTSSYKTSAANNMSVLSSEEQSLILQFRQLNKDNQEEVKKLAGKKLEDEKSSR